MTGNIYKILDKKTGKLKLPVSVTDAIFEGNEKLSKILNDLHQPFFKIRMLSWNVGHWSNGNSISSAVTAATYETTKAGFHKILNDFAPDIVGCCEYSSLFYQNITARDDIFGQYLNAYIGSKQGYVGTAMFANSVFVNKQEISLENGYKAIEVTLQISKEKKLIICMCHLPWNTETAQQNSLQTLINRYSDKENVIIAGDYNMYANHESTTINKLKNAGYQNANWGYLGKILTSYNNDICSNYLDNIAVKGGSILRTQVVQNTPNGKDPDNPQIADEALWDAVNLSDHFPIICDIEFPL